MRVLSVNVGMPRLVEYMGEPLATGIFKEQVAGPVRVNELNLEGDGQADLRVHGGRFKAVYVYPSEHYAFWREELPGVELPWGVFGENLTTEGVTESDVRVGDRICIGSAQFAVTQPRYPCFKLGIRFGRKDIIRRFAKSGRSGFYLSVEKTGEIRTRDRIEHFSSNGNSTISAIFAERLKL